MIPRRSRRVLLLLITVLTAFVGSVIPWAPESLAKVSTPIAAQRISATTRATIDFPKGITVSGILDLGHLEADESDPIELLYRIGSDETMHLVTVPKKAGAGRDQTHVEVLIDLQSSFVPAGVELTVFWRVQLVDGGYAESGSTSVSWFDNRWEWRTIDSSQITLRYVDIDPAFAQSILDSAQSTVTDLERRFALQRSTVITIWIYSSAEAFRGTQQPNSREAVAGASYPGFQLITAIIPDGDDREVGRVIPHEISHQILYQATRNPFALPPLWFDEGLATHYQVGATDGFLEMVIRAHQRGALFGLGSLDVSFPYASENATLAYATSWSVIAYVREVHGDEAIAAMIRAFATGAPYPVAIEQALGMTRDDLNQEWQSWIARQGTTSVLTYAA